MGCSGSTRQEETSPTKVRHGSRKSKKKRKSYFQDPRSSFELQRRMLKKKSHHYEEANLKKSSQDIGKIQKIVKRKDIALELMEIHYRLLSNHISQRNMITFIPHIDLSMKELTHVFEHVPFLVADPDKRVLLARYFLESREKDEIIYTLQKHIPHKEFKKKICEEVCDFQRDPEEDIIEDIYEIARNIELKRPQMMEEFRKVDTDNTGHITKEELLAMFEEHTFGLTPLQVDIILMKLFTSSNSLKELIYSELWSVFEHILEELDIEESVNLDSDSFDGDIHLLDPKLVREIHYTVDAEDI